MRIYAIIDFSQGKINSTKRLHNDLQFFASAVKYVSLKQELVLPEIIFVGMHEKT